MMFSSRRSLSSGRAERICKPWQLPSLPRARSVRLGALSERSSDCRMDAGALRFGGPVGAAAYQGY